MAGNNAIELYSDLGAVERETVCKSLLVQKFQTPQHMSNQRERLKFRKLILGGGFCYILRSYSHANIN